MAVTPNRGGPGLGLRPLPRGSVLRALDSCQPRSEQRGPAQGGLVFSGWYVPHWLMLQVKDALRKADSR